MTQINIIDPARDPLWDAFVARHPHGKVFHLAAWKQVLDSSFPHMKSHYAVRLSADGTRIEAALPMFVVRSRLTGTRLVSLPFAPICDPLVSTAPAMDEFVAHSVDLSREVGARFIEIRTLAAAHLINGHACFGRVLYRNHTLDLGPDIQSIYCSLHRKGVRRFVRKSLAGGLSFEADRDGRLLGDFFSLYVMTRRRHRLPPMPRAFFENIIRIMGPSGQAEILCARKNEKPAAALLAVRFGDHLTLLEAGDDSALKELLPYHFLYWNCITAAHAQGIKTLDFGRTAPHNQGLCNFKRRWGTVEKDIYVYFYPPPTAAAKRHEEASLLRRAVGSLFSLAPLPVLARLGDVIYRHMG